MKLLIDIPKEFEQHFQIDRFEDSLNRLSADANLLAGLYEQETVLMLNEAFKNATLIPPHGRLIDADALYSETEKKIKANHEYRMAVVDDEFLDLINDADTVDAVEVVRCKDCVFWNTDKKGFSDECVCRRFSVLNVCDKYTLPTDFCSYGERREK